MLVYLPVVASCIKDILSWPLVILCIAVLLKKPLANLCGNIQSIKYGDFEMSVSKKIAFSGYKLKLLFNQNREKIENKDIPAIFRKKYTRIAKVSPFAVILFAYAQIENTLMHDFVTPYGMAEKKEINRIVNTFKKNDLNDEIHALFFKLQEIHTLVLDKNLVHITKKDSLSYGKAAGYLIALISSLWQP